MKARKTSLLVCVMVVFLMYSCSLSYSEEMNSSDSNIITYEGFSFEIPHECELTDVDNKTGSVTYESGDDEIFTIIRFMSHTKGISVVPKEFFKEEQIYELLETIIKRKDGYLNVRFEEENINGALCRISYSIYEDDYYWFEIGAYYNGKLVKVTYVTNISNEKAVEEFGLLVESLQPVVD